MTDQNHIFRYVVVEYYFDDNSNDGSKNVLGAYPDMRSARKAAGEYIKRNVTRMKKKYRCWQVRVVKERVFFDIKGF